MSNTTNLGLPLMPDTPVEGVTGLELRKMINGENEDSMAQILDRIIEPNTNKATASSNEVMPDDDTKFPTCALINKVLSNIRGGMEEEATNGLPDVTTSDNGKILKVIDGTWQLADDETTVAMEEIDIFPEQEVTTYLNSTFNKYQWGSTNAFILEDGEEYIIEYDGEVYTCVASTMTAETMTGIGAGNQGILGIGNDTGEPFLVGYLNESNFAGVFNNDTANTKHTLRIYQLKEKSSSSEYEVIQSDWEENDKTSKSYILNRPFYQGNITYTEIIPSTNIEINSTFMELGSIDISNISIGDTYIVDYDNKEYQCVIGSYFLEGESYAYLGNFYEFLRLFPKIKDESLSQNNEPFCFLIVEENGVASVLLVDFENAKGLNITYRTFRILHVNNDLKTIDKKYIPKDFNADWNYILNKPFYYNKTSVKILNDISIEFSDIDGEWQHIKEISIDEFSSVINHGTSLVRVVWDNVEYMTFFSKIDSMLIAVAEINDDKIKMIAIEPTINNNQTYTMHLVMNNPEDENIISENHNITIDLITEACKKLDKNVISSDWNYTSNKPFYEYKKGDIVCNECINNLGSSTMLLNNLKQDMLIEGAKYNISFNYIDNYTGLGLQGEAETAVIIVFDKSGENLICGIGYNGEIPIIQFQDTSFIQTGSNIIKVTFAEDYVKKIDAIYLPDKKQTYVSSISSSDGYGNGNIFSKNGNVHLNMSRTSSSCTADTTYISLNVPITERYYNDLKEILLENTFNDISNYKVLFLSENGVKFLLTATLSDVDGITFKLTAKETNSTPGSLNIFAVI